MTAKAPGRVGDTPMIGAGTFADNATCAVSATGHGEVFIRWNAAGEIAARMRHAGEDLATAADHVVLQDLAPNDGSGGVIAVDGAGNIAMPFNSQGMYRGSVRQGSAPKPTSTERPRPSVALLQLRAGQMRPVEGHPPSKS